MELKVFTEKLFNEAMKEGFAEYEIYYVNDKGISIEVFEKEIEKYEVSGSLGLSFRGLFNGKMGYAYTEVLDEASIDFLIKEVKDNSNSIENEDVEIIYGGNDTYSLFEGYSKELEEISTDKKIAIALALENETKLQNNKVLRVENQTFFGESFKHISNSKGLNLSYRSNVAMILAGPIVEDNEKMNFGYAYRCTNNTGELDVKSIAKEAVQEALAYIGAQTVESGRYKVILRNDVAASILQTFSGVFSSDNVQKGLSLLKDREGKKIASEKVILMDNPLLQGGLCSSPFDAEGVAAYTKEVIYHGVLNTLLYNLKTGKKDRRKSTGNASKTSYFSPVEVSPSNFYFKPGEKDIKELFNEMNKGVFITDVQGLHSGANPVSGEFSLAAKGMFIENGKIRNSVEQITVSGNFYQLLKDIEAVGNDLKFGFPSGKGYYGSPSILVKELYIAGK